MMPANQESSQDLQYEEVTIGNLKMQKLVKKNYLNDGTQVRKSITRVDSPVFERKPAALTTIQTTSAPATFFEMAGGYDHDSESSSNSEDSPVFNCGKKERKNSML
jgi:hypothetical protein